MFNSRKNSKNNFKQRNNRNTNKQIGIKDRGITGIFKTRYRCPPGTQAAGAKKFPGGFSVREWGVFLLRNFVITSRYNFTR